MWGIHSSIEETPAIEEASTIFSLKGNIKTEEAEVPSESYSIKARKFKELQFLREMKARNSFQDYDGKAVQNKCGDQPYFDISADYLNGGVPKKVEIPQRTEQRPHTTNLGVVNRRTSSDKVVVNHQQQENRADNKQRLTSTYQQGFRIKKEITPSQDYFGADHKGFVVPALNQTPRAFQQIYDEKASFSDVNKAYSLRDVNRLPKMSARSNKGVQDEEKESIDEKNQLPPRFDNQYIKRRPQSKDSSRALGLNSISDIRPNTSSTQVDSRLILKKGITSSGNDLDSELRTPKNKIESLGFTSMDALEFTPFKISPSNDNLLGTNTNQRDVSLRDLKSDKKNMFPPGNQGRSLQTAGGEIDGQQRRARMIQPLIARASEDSDLDSKDRLGLPQRRPNEVPSYMRNIQNVPKRFGNENMNSENKDLKDRERLVRPATNLPGRTRADLKANNSGQNQQQDQKRPERRLESRSPPKVAQIKVNNTAKIEQLIRGKHTFNHKANMTEYLKRRGLKEDVKVFCFNSRDEHIRRALKKIGWIENPNPGSFLYDFKWTYTDYEADYSNLMEGQYFNHFQNNKELTMKSGLIENVRACMEHGSDFWTFFPRAYDLGHMNQMREFHEDFERTALINLIRKHWKYIKMRVDSQLIKSVKDKFVARQEKRSKVRLIDIFKKKRLIKSYEYKSETARKDFQIHLSILESALHCIRTLIHQHKCVAEAENFHTLGQMNAKMKGLLLAYSKFSPPYDEASIATKKTLGGEEQWETPNELLIYKIYKFKELTKKFFPQYYIDGTENIWIIKASGNSRGSGIFLIDSLEEALDSGMKNQARIIQKYIERPMVISDFPYKQMNKKKFDIRQWVLVSSMNPLVIYMFSSCYIRLCSQEFELGDIKNQFKHLTNFSLNKGNFQTGEDSICHIDILKSYLKSARNIDWDAQVKPKIVDIIIKTVSGATDSIEQRSGCFEVYGFDLMLDEKCDPWLLEVNLSPACAERTPWLIKMLDDMGETLLKCLLPPSYITVQNVENTEKGQDASAGSEKPTQKKEEEELQYSWELIHKGEVPKDFAGNANLALEIVGTKANVRKEQEIDRKYFAHM